MKSPTTYIITMLVFVVLLVLLVFRVEVSTPAHAEQAEPQGGFEERQTRALETIASELGRIRRDCERQ